MNIRNSLIIGMFLALFAQAASAQDTKIGVLNALQALFNSDAAQVVQTELEQEFAVDEARATELTEQLQGLQEEYQQNEAVMTEDEIRRMNASAQDLHSRRFKRRTRNFWRACRKSLPLPLLMSWQKVDSI